MTERNKKVGGYEVGYGKPSRDTQFKPGQTGNRGGREKGSKNLKTDLTEELSEQITLREGGRVIRISKRRALVKSAITLAIKDDPRAQAKAFDLLLKFFGADDEPNATANVTEEDEAILAAYLNRKKGERS
jgi:hypothetical protein